MSYTPLPPDAAHQPRIPLPRYLPFVIPVLALIAAVSAAHVTWQSFQSGPIPGCSASAIIDCDHVTSSAWSYLGDIPIGLLGAATYFSIFAVSCCIGPWISPLMQRPALVVLTTLIVMAAGAAVWFVYLQAFVIGKFCTYCMVSHTCGLLMASILLPALFLQADARRVRAVAGGLGVLGVALLVTLQSLFPHATFVVETYPDIREDATPDWMLGVGPGDAVLDDGDSQERPAEAPVDDSFFASPLDDLASGDFDQHPAGGNRSSDASSSAETTELPEAAPTLASDNGSPPRRPTADITADDLQLSHSPTDAAGSAADGIRSTPAESGQTRTVLKPPALQRRLVRYFGNQPSINIYDYPHLGDPESPDVIVELMDYTCHHCRAMYPYLEAARERYGDQLVVVLRPIANHRRCNVFVNQSHPDHTDSCDYVKLALAVWLAAPHQFEAFHDWLMVTEPIPSVAAAEAYSDELVGADLMREALAARDISLMMNDNHRVWNRVGGSLPILFAAQKKISGVPSTQDEFFRVVASLLGEPRQLSARLP